MLAVAGRRVEPLRKPCAVPGDPAVGPTCENHRPGKAKRESEYGGAGESPEGFANSFGAGENVVLLVDQMQLVAAAISGNPCKSLFEIRLLEGNQFEPLFAILPVDPPGESPSEPSLAIVDNYGLPIVHLNPRSSKAEKRISSGFGFACWHV